MLSATVYPITIAEMRSYSEEADRVFQRDEHEELKTFLALHPEAGDTLKGAGGVRLLRWSVKREGKKTPLRVIYYFRDLNMPLYMLALYEKGERMKLDMKHREEICSCVNELVKEHSDNWAKVIAAQTSGA